jgi:hypothetical protein
MNHNYKEPVESLRVFGKNLIDYAGLFPPASLNLAQAFNNFIMYLDGNYKWMLSRFIIPAKKLGELAELMNRVKYSDNLILPFSVLGSGGDTFDEFAYNFESDLKYIIEFQNKFGKRVTTDVYETRLPGILVEEGSPKDLSGLMSIVSGTFEKTLGRKVNVFYEAVLKDDFNIMAVKTAEAISLYNGKSSSAGFKLRTGGTAAGAFPTPEEIAFAIFSCIEYNIPMKCTAGLHHPIRHYDESVQTNMHGFLNVFGAGILAYSCGLDEAETIDILNEEDPYTFHFSEDGIEFKDYEVTIDEIKEAREKFMVSYGSCSFDDPVDDLKTMELL